MTTNTAPVDDFAGEWAVEADGKLLIMFRDNGHSQAQVEEVAQTFSLVREAVAAGKTIAVHPMTVAELRAGCSHTFLAADGECWRCGEMVTG